MKIKNNYISCNSSPLKLNDSIVLYKAGSDKVGNLMLIVCFFFVFFLSKSYSQVYSYTHYDFKDGLSGINVNGLIQDSDGFIWMTTETGLSIFDGVHFRNFRREDGLPSNEVFAAFEDSRHRIWLTCYKNEVCYFYKGKIHNQQNDPILRKLHLDCEIAGIAEDVAGNILLLTTHLRTVISPRGEITQLTQGNPEELEHFKIETGIGFSFDPEMADTKCRFVGDHWFIAPVKNQNFSIKKRMLLLKFPREVLVLKENHVISSLKMSAAARVKPVNDSIIAILGDTTSGAGFYNVNQQKYVARYLTDYTIHDVIRDIEGNLWFSTKESGVFKLNPSSFQLFSFRQNTVPMSVVNVFNIGNKVFANTSDNQCWQLKSVNPLRFDKLSFAVNKNLLLYFGRQNMHQMINYSGSDFMHINQPTITVKSVFAIGGDTLLISTNSNAMLLQYSGLQAVRILHTGRSTCSFKVNERYYIGTLNGLYCVDGNGKESFIGETYPSLRNRISSLAYGQDSILWIATYENGIIGYKNNKIVANITQEKNGLSSNICRCIQSNGDTLWVGTEKGLNKVEKVKEGYYRTTQKFTMADGLTSDIVNAVYVNGNEVFVGTSDGLVYFDESKVPRHGFCRLYLTDINISDRPIARDSNGFKLSHANNNISFRFAALSFLSEDDITYVYRLHGLDDVWKKTKDPQFSYPSLPSGKYTLEIFAVNKFSDTSQLITRDFEVKPKLTERKWFQAFSLLAFIGCCVLTVHLRIKSLNRKNRERNEIRQKIIELEQAALRAQMNPHFIFNCLNSIQHYIMKRDMIQVSVYLSKFANLVRQTLENAPKLYILLREELEYLENYIALEKLQIGDALQYSIKVNRKLDKEQIKIPNMIIQPFVENAIKHGVSQVPSGAVLNLSFDYLSNEQLLRCVIEDNGPGINLTQELQQKNIRYHTPKGLLITQSRIETLSQIHESHRKITIEMEEIAPEAIFKGTRIIIHFPL